MWHAADYSRLQRNEFVDATWLLAHVKDDACHGTLLHLLPTAVNLHLAHYTAWEEWLESTSQTGLYLILVRRENMPLLQFLLHLKILQTSTISPISRVVWGHFLVAFFNLGSETAIPRTTQEQVSTLHLHCATDRPAHAADSLLHFTAPLTLSHSIADLQCV